MGDTVLVKQGRKDTFTSRFDKPPCVVIYRKGSIVIAKSNQKRRMRRNISYFKKFESAIDGLEQTESEWKMKDEIIRNNNELDY